MSKMTSSNLHKVKDKTGEVLQLNDEVEAYLGMRGFSGRVIGFGCVPPFVMVEDSEGMVFTLESDQMLSDRGGNRLIKEAEAKR